MHLDVAAEPKALVSVGWPANEPGGDVVKMKGLSQLDRWSSRKLLQPEPLENRWSADRISLPPVARDASGNRYRDCN